MKKGLLSIIFSLILVASCNGDSGKIVTTDNKVMAKKIAHSGDMNSKNAPISLKKEQEKVVPVAVENNPNATAGEIVHKVSKGDCIWNLGKDYGVSVEAIKKINPQIVHPKSWIFPGQILTIPTIEKKSDSPKIAQATKKAVAKISKKSATQKSDVIRLKGLRIYTEETIGHDKYKGTPEFASFLLGIISKNEIANTKVILIYEEPSHIKKGDIFQMTSGRNKVGKYKAGLKDKHLIAIEKARVFVKGNFVGDIFLNKWCGNWIWFMDIPPETVVENPTPEPALKPQKDIVFPVEKIILEEEPKYVPPKKKECIVRRHEVNAGNGVWTNSDAHGIWGFGEYFYKPQNCAGDISLFGAQPKIGFFGRADIGETDSNYRWNSRGIGPAAALVWGGKTENGYAQSFEIKMRSLFESIHADNSDVRYSKNEDHFLGGFYAGYDRRISPKDSILVFSEGWKDFHQKIESSLPGDQASDRSSIAVGAGYKRDITDLWAIQTNAQLNYTPEDERFGVGGSVEGKYNQWLSLGFGVNQTVDSSVPNEDRGISYGPSIKVEKSF